MDRKRARDEEVAPSSALDLSSPVRQGGLRRLRQGAELESSLLSSELNQEEDEFIREDEDELRRVDEALEDDDEGEDLFGDAMERDYQQNIVLDNYDHEELDDQEYDAMDIGERRLLEKQMDKENRGRRNVPGAYEDDDDEPVIAQPRRRRLQVEDDVAMEEGVQIDFETLSDMKGGYLAEYLEMPGPQQHFKGEFKHFLMTFIDSDEAVYAERIKNMCENNGESLEVSYTHLAKTKPTLAYILSNAPMQTLKMFNEVAKNVTLEAFPNYENIKSEIHVRIDDLPTVDLLRDLRQIHLNCLVRVRGVVTRRTNVFPQLKYVKYNCGKCGEILGPFYQDTDPNSDIKLKNCPHCESKGPFHINSDQTVYRDYQRLTLQESPGTVPAGRMPRTREVILLWDLIDSARPGEEVEITGIYRNNFDLALNTRNGFPVFSTLIEANHISRKEELYASHRMTEEDERQIKELARDPKIGERIIKSIAPSIYGHEDIKTALALALMGGVSKNPQEKHRIRGDINVLMLGDPGTAKSQFLKYVEKTAHRAVFTTGQGASAVGLTASVRKDPVTREWTLEGGALVLADKGVCLIDEFDKMNDQDRTSIHEAMEQQSISISKAGIVTTLQARATVIAAANPIRGRYDPRLPFNMNVELTEPILSRFDVLLVVQDRVDPIVDNLLAEHVINSHIASHPQYRLLPESQRLAHVTQDADIIPQEMLKKYIMFAKERITPRLAGVDADRLANVYAELRRASLVGDSIPITVRHLESMIRMSEAHARLHLRDEVRGDDVDMAIRVMVDSFVKAQKWSVRRQMQKQFSRYINFHRDNNQLLNHVLGDLVRDHLKFYHLRNGDDHLPERLEVDLGDFEARAREHGVFDCQPFYSSPLFTRNGFSVGREGNQAKIVKTF